MRKITATVEGTIFVPVRVKRKVTIEADEGEDVDYCLRRAGRGLSDDTFDIVHNTDIELTDATEDIEASIKTVNEENLLVHNVIIEDSK